MKYKGIIILSIVLLISVVFIFLLFDTSEDEVLFSFELESKEGKESISYHTDEDDSLYVFLPSYGELPDLKIHLLTETTVEIDGVKLTEGMSCEGFELDKTYEVSYEKWGTNSNIQLTFCKSANIPAMYIDTQSGNIEYIHQKKGNEEQGTVRLYNADGTLNYSGELESLSGRGNSTWEYYDKKPYSLNLRNQGDLLSMGEAYKWILIANADDYSNVRNKAVYDFSRNIGLDYTPSSQWIDLYLNGDYAGLYLLCERNEVHPNRVDISQSKGFLVSLEMEERLVSQSIPYVSTEEGFALRVHNPLNPTEDDLQRIADVFQAFENAVLSKDGTDEKSGKHWSQLIDVDSFVKKYLIEEVFGNIDACALSQYFYCDATDDYKIYAGPVWDYDHTMGIDSLWQLRNPEMMIGNRPAIASINGTSWFASLYQDKDFYNNIVRVYTEEFKPLLSKLYTEDIAEYESLISESARINKLRWNDVTITSDEEIDNICEYMNNRLSFLDSVWIENTEYLTLRADSSFGVQYAYYSVLPGQSVDCLPEFENTENLIFRGWYDAETNEPFDSSQPLLKDTQIYAKWENTESKLDKIKELIPIGIFAIVFISIFVADIKKNRKGERND